MIEGALRAMFLCWAQGPYCDLLRSNKLFPCQLQKLNLLLQQLVLVRLSGWEEFLKSYSSSKLTTVFCDNNSAIKLSKNPLLHRRSKHIDVKYYFLRDLSNDETIKLVYCRSEDQVADIQTKPLKLATFVKLRGLLGVCSHAAIKEDFVEGWSSFKLIYTDFSLREGVKI